MQVEDLKLKHLMTECEAEQHQLAEGGTPLGEDNLVPIVLWEGVVLLIQTIWDIGEIPQQYLWVTVVRSPKKGAATFVGSIS